MADRPIRVGQVSAVDYETGMIRVVYNDMDQAVSAWIPYATLGNEYHMPEVEDYVLSLHMTNGQEAGLVLGTYWNQQHTPPVSGHDLFRKDYSNSPGAAYLERNPDPEVLLAKFVMDLALQVLIGGDLTVTGGKSVTLSAAEGFTLSCSAGSITVADIIAHIRG